MTSSAIDITHQPYPIGKATFVADDGGESAALSSLGTRASKGNSTTARTVRKSVISVQSKARPSVVGGDRSITSKDIANVFHRSKTFSYVTDEQIERVQKMHRQFKEAAEFCFNYNVLLVVASVLAALGLMSNSSTTIIASMLVSPIMGPVVGMSYGSYIGDRRLTLKSFKTELLSLVFCILTGMALAACAGWTSMAQRWPTTEMVARGNWEALLIGLPVAFFSGLGVAVSLLDEQTSSLVGVAISASLLPPAVNTGVLWVAYFFYRRDVLKGMEVVMVPGENGEEEELLEKYDFFMAGMISFLLTLSNVILVIFASILMFRLKERLPIKKKVAWQDLGVARRIFTDRAITLEGDNLCASDDKQGDTDEENITDEENNSQSTSDVSIDQDSVIVRMLMDEIEDVLSVEGGSSKARPRGKASEQET